MLILLKEKYNVSQIGLFVINNEIYDSNLKEVLFELHSFKTPYVIKFEKLRQFSHTELKGDIVFFKSTIEVLLKSYV